MSRRQDLRSFPRAAAPAPAAAGHRPLLLAVALAAGFSALPAVAQPSGAQAVVGSAALSQSGNKLVVTTTNGAGNFSSINWQSFSVPGGTTTYFAQPGVTSTSINRVVGPDPSLIYGTLGSNGRLVLVNPAGITVGAGAVVDTAAFTASTLRMTDADLLNGRLRFGNGLGSLLKVDGTVLASQGDVVLIGQQVETGPQALIQSHGATVLAAGQKVEITGRGVEGIVFEVQAPADKAVNLGTLKGDAVGVFAGTLKHSGLIQAQAVSTEGGKVVLKAVDIAETGGTIVAQGLAGAGGSVDVLGTKVGVTAGAAITTSNTAGGGSIRIGGDYQGKNADLPNAQVTYVDKDAALHADATGNGNGGKVIVWADDTTRAYGTLSANAGPQGGDGGLVETSGKRYLDANGARVTAVAPNGRAGTWLLDPQDLTIVNGASLLDVILPSGGGTIFEPLFGLLSRVSDSTLLGALNAGSGTNVAVTTTTSSGTDAGDITFQGANLTRSSAGSATLNVNAAGAIRFTGGTTSFQTTGGAGRTLNVNLNSTSGVNTAAGAVVQLSTDDPASAVNVVVTGGKTWTNDGTLTLNQNGAVVLHDGTSPAHFQNGATGLVNGSAGANGGILGSGGGGLGTFNNAGTVSLDQGNFEVAALTSVGSFTQTGSASLRVDGNFAVTSGTFGFTGKDLSLTQATGTLAIPAFASIAATGAVALSATNGAVSIGGTSLSAGELSVFATGNISSTAALVTSGATGGSTGEVIVESSSGTVTVGNINTSVAAGAASVDGGAVFLSGTSVTANGIKTDGYSNPSDPNPGWAGSIDITSTTGGVSVGSITAKGGSGGPALGGRGGDVFVDAGTNATLGAVDTRGGSGVFGGMGGQLSVNADGGAITISGSVNTSAGAGGSTIGGGSGGGGIYLTAVTAIDTQGLAANGNAASGTYGSRGGNIYVYGGSVDIKGAVQTVGGSGDLGAGDGGTVVINSGAGVKLQAGLDAHGGNATSSGYGGSGGFVSIGAAGGAVQLVNVATYGGSAVAFYDGGSGGPVSISSAGGGVTAQSIDTRGGDATYGGRGGDLTVTAAGPVSLQAISTRGGLGGSLGGDGGNLTINAGGAVSTGPIDVSGGDATAIDFDVMGGMAGGVQIGGSSISLGIVMARGGYGEDTGGDGGTVLLNATGGPLTAGAIDLSGGGSGGAGFNYQGGWGGGLVAAGSSITLGPITTRGGYAASFSGNVGGRGGDVALSASAGDIVVNGAIDAMGGNADVAGSGGAVSLFAAGGVTVAGYIDTSGGFGTAARGDVAGDVTISAGGNAVLGSDVAAQGGLGLGTLYFSGPGTLSGSSVLGNVYNEGTIAPGSSSSPIGIFSVAGNYTQTATGRLLFDAVNTTPYIPGVTYDQLQVLGTTDLAGSIEVNTIAAPPAAPPPPPLALAAALSAPAPTATMVLISSAGAITGGFSSVSSPSTVAPVLQISAGGALSYLLVTKLIDPPPPPPAAPPGTALVERIYDLLQQQVTREQVQQALTEQETIVTKFVSLLLKEEKDQADQAKEQGKPDIVSTDASCKPS